ncbi:iron uptake protein [Comamonas sp.]|uniref:iron uptake protein n=1 Tax=Comamonas sp. TaxID=34028 RepID=UPI003A932917
MDTLTSYPGPRMLIALRICAAIFAGYGFTWGFIAGATAGLFALGMAFHDAEHLSAILGLVVYLCAFLWAFSARSLGRVWAVLVGGGAAMAIAASLLQRHLI